MEMTKGLFYREESIMKLLKHILLFAMMTGGLWADITDGCDLDPGTYYLSDADNSLVLYKSSSHCSYCSDGTYNNNTQPWYLSNGTGKKIDCENNGFEWIINYDATVEECSAIPSINDLGGWWFTGDIAGFQFNVEGATLNSISGGDAGANGMFMQTSGDMVLGFFIGGGSMPAGCGTLVVMNLTGVATGLFNVLL